MTLLAPWFGAIVLGIVVPAVVAMYFLRLRRQARAVPSTMLWKRSIEDLRANTPFQRLRWSALLLLQLLLLILLGLALMQPQFDAEAGGVGRYVVLIDKSASMAVADVDDQGTTRLELAKRSAAERVEALHSGGLFSREAPEIMVIGFGSAPDIRISFSDSKRDVLAAIEKIEQTDEGSRIGEAITLARAYTTVVDPENPGPMVSPAQLELWSDGRIEDLADQALRAGETLEYRQVGDPSTTNVGVAAVAAERPYDQPGSIQVFAAIENPDEDPVSVDLQLSIDGSIVAILPEPIQIPGAVTDEAAGRRPGRRQISFPPVEQPRGAVIEVAILSGDALTVDNVAGLVVPASRRLKVALVGKGGFILRSLLEGMSLEGLDVLSSEAFRAAIDDGTLPDYDVVVLEGGSVGPLPPGRYLSFGETPEVEGLTEFGESERGVLVRRSRDEHPVLRFVNLDELFVGRMSKLTTAPGVRTLVDSGDGPLVVELDRGPLHLIHATFDPLDSNWPYLRSFVNFVPNAIEYLGTSGDALTSKSFAPGEPIVARVPGGASDVVVRTPEGVAHRVTPDAGGRLSWGPVDRAGLYEVSWNDSTGVGVTGRMVAVNQLSSDERWVGASEQTIFGVEEIAGDRVEAERATRWQDLWPWLLGMVVALSMLEWYLWQRQAGAG